jgi:hypothetical protein
VGYAVNNAANLHLFMQQTAVEHSGNVRTVGPKPPMLAICSVLRNPRLSPAL